MTLQEFLNTEQGKQVSQAEWARRVGITRGYLCQMRDGLRLPSLTVAYRLEKATGGMVRMQDWMSGDTDAIQNQRLRGKTAPQVEAPSS